jgi:hypothetical protein
MGLALPDGLAREGESPLNTAEGSRTCREGEVFTMAADLSHAKAFGAQGLRYLVGRPIRSVTATPAQGRTTPPGPAPDERAGRWPARGDWRTGGGAVHAPPASVMAGAGASCIPTRAC